MKRKLIAIIGAAVLVASPGCAALETPGPMTEWAVRKVNDVLAGVGAGVVSVLDGIHNAEFPGGPFENDLESARAYVLDQLLKKYGEEFMIAGEEDLENYGLFAGASYTCEVAPVAFPERVATAFVSQSRYQNVRDDYAVYFFADAAEKPVEDLCRSKSYVLDQRVTLELPETERTWHEDDPLDRFLSESGAYVKATLRFEDGLDAGTYAGCLLDFIESLEGQRCNVLLQAKADKTYIFHGEIEILEDFSPDDYDLETLEEDIRENMEIGGPRSFAS